VKEETLELGSAYYTIALEAVRQNGHAFRHVKTPPTPSTSTSSLFAEIYLKIALEAIKQTGFAIQYIKYDKSNTDPTVTLENYTMLALEAIKQNPKAIKYIDKEYQTLEMIKEYMKTDIYTSNVNLSFINKVNTTFTDGSIDTLSVSKQPKNTIKITTHSETILIETVKTLLPISDYIKSKHENIIVVDSLDKMVSTDTLYMTQTSDKLYEVYKVDKVSVVKKGWIYNSEDVQSKPIKIATYELCTK